jgi:diguanylate cyclase (GGDEF)-like protein
MNSSDTAMIMFVDISDRKRAEQQLEHEMLHDQSTGLANRILFHDRVNSHFHRNLRLGLPTCVMSLDINRFAFILESLGYDAADLLISKIAKRIESVIHPLDMLARVGSSEFALLVEHIHSEDQARDFCLNLLDQFRNPFDINEQEILVEPSVGITITHKDQVSDADTILHDAHAAMTQARDNQSIQYSFSSASRSSEAFKKLTRERELHSAIDKGQLAVFYQPQIDITSRKIVGAEALVRWIHPEHGIVPPDQFVPLAEESGLIDSLFDSVFSTVISDAGRLQAQGHNIILWTNLSAKQFSIGSTPKLLARHIAEADVPPSMLGIEITETAVMENSESAQEILTQLKQLGINLALDDFGTGYSSLAYLQSFPVDVIKIDQTFVRELGSDRASVGIVSAVIGLAHGLQLQCLAEGVESQDAIDILTVLGCDHSQGYFFAHPMNFSQFVDFIS